MFLASCSLLFSCAPRSATTGPPKPAAPRATFAPKAKAKEIPDGLVSLQIDAALDADPLAKGFEKRLRNAGFRVAPESTARFFVTFKVKEGMTPAPPAGKEIAKVAYLVTTLDHQENIRLDQRAGEETGIGPTLDAALDAALAAVAEKVTPPLIEVMLQRLRIDSGDAAR